jgi:hypothetical protein
MPVVQHYDVPPESMLRAYHGGTGFADCYVVTVPGIISQARFVEAFYTSPLFKVERTGLRYFAARPGSDADARDLAEGRVDTFSAWRVEGRSASELLLADFTGRTRSWLMALPAADAKTNDSPQTRLYFGSAVVPRSRKGAQAPDMGWLFHSLLGFHRLYSRLLLSAARRRVLKT